MKYVFFLISIVLSLNSVAQNRPFLGRVTDNHKKGIPFAVVEIKGKNQGVYCNEDGFFAFTGNADSIKTLSVSCMGYEKREISTERLPPDSIIVELQLRVATLKEVAIKAKKDVEERILGKSRNNISYTGDCYRYYGSETAILLKADRAGEGTLKDIFVYITNDGDPYTKFRVHVYSWDTSTILPGREITNSNLIAAATSGNTWVKVNVSSLQIPVNEGVFVSVEWISGFGNDARRLQSGLNPEVTGYNGQVLGLTSDYSRQSITYSRKPFHTKWEYYDPPNAPRMAGRFLNPMIYCTYAYVR